MAVWEVYGGRHVVRNQFAASKFWLAVRLRKVRILPVFGIRVHTFGRDKRAVVCSAEDCYSDMTIPGSFEGSESSTR